MLPNRMLDMYIILKLGVRWFGGLACLCSSDGTN